MFRLRASHILVSTLEEAQAIKTLLEGGGDFAQIAKQRSRCPSGQKGGNLGDFAKGGMVKPFEDALLGLEFDQISDPVQTQFGYHIIKRHATPGVQI
jgi:peptidyl-prolyl cis-trans isomerase C